MPKIESEITIQAPLDIVWELAQDVEKLPDIMPDLEKVRVLERKIETPVTTRVVTDWKGRIKQFNRKIEWTEEDIWNSEQHTCHFWQLRGDFTEYRGEWGFQDVDGATRAYLIVEYKFEIPLIGAMMQKVVQKLMRDNSDTMLQALQQEAERRVAAA